ncbi:MAG: tRNA (adenosine(37)-N6)-threonylcarbamoyltransferase complex ATPase subunit type 1 TsaE [Candidatus Cyclonatronum sp.]|uniref:tRNA (adenosine(37)-N6)-threonylcarbamoyltransferase complex ATPase subunit type 1 TsaE n=1 Tax=Cyclonatronum sp. TaxID=3024185 RepID=UPI0025C19E5D|nr:tRNA (adenosine(37)-N6)-threonylcarbamoyltransferase complex ATPase subunit type 1 TsaE [Cyclonatronum sp.]MCC5933947.1 tRNA (adenosine(37)-N6)-threonylcarbamoyltransferase complex ATPase subunit type 1 TsaE [Balneolales bacterium]MCH8486412.1 tRNA (adenosine(37)-N6)-threonylcarbamoyltransferase complex ATPase subunit type 1 TsaE [Cyclonatronum sp.]
MKNAVFNTASPQETLALGAEMAKNMASGDVICLFGDLGAGKTHFVKGVASAFGIPEKEVDSPTFVLIQEYEGTLPLYHFDAYRIASLEEARRLGMEEYFYGDGICLIEWPERIAGLLPEQRTEVHFSHTGPSSRRVEVLHKY